MKQIEIKIQSVLRNPNLKPHFSGLISYHLFLQCLHFFLLIFTQIRLLSSTAGVSNSECLAGCMRLKDRSCWPHFKKWKKLPSNFQLKTKNSWKNRQIVYELKKKTAEFLDVHGPRVWDRCSTVPNLAQSTKNCSTSLMKIKQNLFICKCYKYEYIMKLDKIRVLQSRIICHSDCREIWCCYSRRPIQNRKIRNSMLTFPFGVNYVFGSDYVIGKLSTCSSPCFKILLTVSIVVVTES